MNQNQSRTWQIKEAVEDALKRKRTSQPTLYMLGSTDVGKTHTVIEIANMCYDWGLRVAIIDADVGQSDIGPPCCIGMGMLHKRIMNLHEVEPYSLYFVGNTSPSGCTNECLRGIAAAVQDAKAHNPDIILVDSTGWIEGEEARNFKLHEITLVKPSLIIAIERDDELEPILRLLLFYSDNHNDKDNCPILPVILRLHADERVVCRTREERRQMRAYSYRRYFRTAKYRAFPSILISEHNYQFEPGRLVGLFDARKTCLGLGILMGVNDSRVVIFTPVTGEVSEIKLARVKPDL
ncbi:MAG: hypothetical protein J7J01_07825 [Methanophagales archaeon]|nr:hypothetical protein [Methanophagales archaeon]